MIQCALKLTNGASCEDELEDFPKDGSTDMQLAWLNQLARRVVERCWLPYSATDLRVASLCAQAPSVGNEEYEPYCYCTCQQGGWLLFII